MKTDNVTMNEIKRLVALWANEVDRSDLKDSTKKTYILHPGHFVRWCEDNFPIRGIQ